MRWVVSAVLLCCAVACGSRSGLDPSPEQALNVSLVCPASPQLVAVGQSLALTTEVQPRAELSVGRWLVAEGAPIELRQEDDARAHVTSSVPSLSTLAYEAYFSDGSHHRCETVVEVVERVSARCPAGPVVALIDQATSVTGTVFDAIGIEDGQWRLAGEAPAWLQITEQSNTQGRVVADIVASRSGTARMELVATNVHGETDMCAVDVFVPETLSATCASEVRAGAGESVELQVRLHSGGPFATHELMVAADDEALPAAKWGSFALEDSLATVRFTPLASGTFEVEHRLADPYGQTATCHTRVVAEPGAPTVQCPAVVETEPLERVVVRAHVSDDEGTPTLQWDLITKPPGSDAETPAPRDAPQTSFRPDLAGSYVLRLTATDASGLHGICETTVLAIATEGLRVEMFWDTDRTDMDLHVLSPDADAWFTSLDCHFANCTTGLAWGDASEDDNPRLDIDDTNGFGPENINIDLPESSVYDIGVHAFQGRSQENSVTVRIYCGGSTTEPHSTIGPVRLRGATSPFSNDFWKVAHVHIAEDGACEVSAIVGADGGPRIVTGTAASLMR